MSDAINITAHGRKPVRVYLNGELVLNVIQAKPSAEGQKGFVVTCTIGLNGKPLYGPNGAILTKINWGYVVIEDGGIKA